MIVTINPKNIGRCSGANIPSVSSVRLGFF